MAEEVRAPAAAIRRQLEDVFAAWGLSEAEIGPTVDVMVETDLRGVDSHGLAMLPLYAQWRRNGMLTFPAQIRVVRESPVTGLIDGGNGLGHAPSVRAMSLAVAKAKQIGLAAVAVRRSNHFGAAGAYALIAARAGLIGLAATSAGSATIVPTRGRKPMFGTNPLAFAAPAGRNKPFVLDMATSTVAVGKVKLAWFAGKPLPPGWTLDPQGRQVTDAAEAFDGHGRVKPGYGMTPLGGLPEMSSHKGYGLAAMVEILCAMLPGATYIGTRDARRGKVDRQDVGHFFLALDPAAFRDFGDYAFDVDDMVDALRASEPVDPKQPVLVAGDPEDASYAERSRDGVPLPAKLIEQVRDIARESNARFSLLDGG